VALDIVSVLVPRLLKTASFRLTALYSVVFMLSFGLLLILTYLTLTAALRDQIKVKVTEDQQTLITESKEDGLNSVAKDIQERTGLSASLGAFYYLEDATGQRLAGNLNKIPRVEGWQEKPFQNTVADYAGIDADEDHQLWGQGKVMSDGSFLFVGQDAIRVLSAQEAIIDTFLWSAGIALLLAAVVGTMISQGFLRRIDAINRTSQSIMSGTLKARIPVSGTSDEIDQLSFNLNKLFDRNQDLLESLKQVTTNIAHDLRSPLSRLRQGLETARTGHSNAKRYGDAIDNAIQESDQLLSTFAALLRIAQIESGSRKAAFRQFDLSAVVNRLVGAYQAVAEDQGKSLTSTVEKNVAFHGDSELIIQALANLLENALQHTPVGSQIDIGLAQTASGAELAVSDTGPGIPVEDRKRVFERFFRLERSRTTPGNGLGLTLVAAVAELHQVAMELQDNEPGLKVQLRFPAS
jgi:signal transduction histidine kinase